jgi:hypothetical protein
MHLSSGGRGDAVVKSALFADAKPADQFPVPIGILPLEVVKEPATLSDELQKAPSRVMILGVRLEMFSQVIDALAEQRHLNFGRARIGCVGLVGTDNLGLAILAKYHV